MGVLVVQFSCSVFSLFSGVNMMILSVMFCCLLGLSVLIAAAVIHSFIYLHQTNGPYHNKKR